MSDTEWLISERDLPALALGAAILGTGGGGNPYIGMLRAREVLRGGATMRVVPLDNVPDDAWVGTVGTIGAPLVGIEKLAEGKETLRAVRAIEAAAGKRMFALIAAEIGGANCMAPLIAAAHAGLPVVDGDGMGRAFPEIQMSTFSIYSDGSREGMTAMSDAAGNVVVIRQSVDARASERLARAITVAMGGTAGAAGAPMSGAFVKRTAIPSTMSQALRIGRAVLEARERRDDVIALTAAVCNGVLRFTGSIVDVERALHGGFVRGQVRLIGTEAWAGCQARIAIQNEYLVLWIDDTVATCVPDLVVVLERDVGEPITTEALRFGQQVAVLALPAHPLLRTEPALQVVGPAAFGYPDVRYVPLEA